MIKLKTVQRPNPKDATAARKYYVSSQNSGDVTLEEMSEEISDRCTLTETDVLAAISALQREMIKNLLAGKIVRFGTFGSFQLSLSSSGVETADDASQSQVRSARVRFRPGARIQDNLKLLKYSLSAE
ncbi:MAG TPA: DNA-binding domain-containing protein [Paludibacter sp.]|nr:DNA-binding domain-containing protein [Paludibacter sp.]